MSAVEWLSLGVAAVALYVSARAAHSASNASSTANDLQSRILAIEVAREDERRSGQRRASVVAFFASSGADGKIYLRNEGASTARDVEVFLDSVNLRNSKNRVGSMNQPVVLGTKAEIGFHYVRTLGSKGHFKVRVTWSDDSGAPGEWASDLSF